jgi:hypothetical protein
MVKRFTFSGQEYVEDMKVLLAVRLPRDAALLQQICLHRRRGDAAVLAAVGGCLGRV